LLIRVDSGEHRSVILHDDWANTDIRPGDTINTIGEFFPSLRPPSTPTISITSQHHFLIHHPDLLLTATSLSNTLQCRRRPLLGQLVRSVSDVTPSLVWGVMLHEVMQASLTSGRWELDWIHARIDEIVVRSLPDLVKIGLGVEEATKEVKLRAKGLETFAKKYIAKVPKVRKSRYEKKNNLNVCVLL
jgi:DNA replication ATP-dependent helicase Dna2